MALLAILLVGVGCSNTHVVLERERCKSERMEGRREVALKLMQSRTVVHER